MMGVVELREDNLYVLYCNSYLAPYLSDYSGKNIPITDMFGGLVQQAIEMYKVTFSPLFHSPLPPFTSVFPTGV